MKITGIDMFAIRLPTRRQHLWATSNQDIGNGYVIMQLRTDEGITGLGEATVMAEWGGDYHQHYGETYGTVMHLTRDYLVPAIQGLDPMDQETLHARMDRAVRGHPYAKAAIDMACFDAVGKALGVPVYKLLGGCARSAIPIAHSLGLMPVEVALREAEAAVSEGIRTIKIKAGVDLERDVALILELRRILGPKIDLVVDANQSYYTVATALDAARRMAPARIKYFEQPVEGLAALADLARRIDTPIMADESIWTPQEALAIAEARAAQFLSIYTAKPGGLHNARKVAAVAEAGGLYGNVNGSGESGVGIAANLHLAAAFRVFTESSVMPITTLKGREQTKTAGVFFVDDIVKEPFLFRDGCLHVPNKPGLGVELDEKKVALYRIA